MLYFNAKPLINRLIAFLIYQNLPTAFLIY